MTSTGGEDDATALRFEHQVAGHGTLQRFGLDCIGKPLIPSELWFYTRLWDDQDPAAVLRPHVPPFQGVSVPGSQNQALISDPEVWNRLSDPWKDSSGGEADGSFLVLADLTRGMVSPCVLDLKVGTRQHGDRCPPKKRAYQEAKCASTTSAQYGLRFCGMRLYDRICRSYVVDDKSVGRTAERKVLAEAIRRFLSAGADSPDNSLVRQFSRHLQNLRTAVETAVLHYRFYSSSILLVYDAAQEQPEAILRMIDFAHVHTRDESSAATPSDDGYLLGLDTFSSILNEFCGGD